MTWVLKVGGSLYHHPDLPQIVTHASGFSSPPLIVAGGSVFADQVRDAQRRWQFDDGAAHSMALLGMYQYAMLLAGVSGFSIRILSQRNDRPCLWLPNEDDLSRELPRNWQVTSDSIAADLTKRLSADHLVLIKSVSPESVSDVRQLVDACFFQLVESIPSVSIVSAEQWLAADTLDALSVC